MPTFSADDKTVKLLSSVLFSVYYSYLNLLIFASTPIATDLPIDRYSSLTPNILRPKFAHEHSSNHRHDGKQLFVSSFGAVAEVQVFYLGNGGSRPKLVKIDQSETIFWSSVYLQLSRVFVFVLTDFCLVFVSTSV